MLRWSVGILLTLLAAALVALVFIPELRQVVISETARRVPVLRQSIATPSTPIEQRLQANGFTLGQAVILRIFKEESELEVWMKTSDRYTRFATYPICKWSGSLGPKLKEGDGQSPEGYYFASAQQLLPTSRYHRAINTGFPNAFDSFHGRTGSVLMIHGNCVSIGCYAMTDVGIDDIYQIIEAAIDGGSQHVEMHLYPFRFIAENFERHKTSPWLPFWKNLAEGDSFFMQTQKPLDVYNCQGRYGFGAAVPHCERIEAWN